MLDSFNNWLLDTALNHSIMNINWIWPLFETLHFFGLCLLLGSLLVIDLRLIGFFKGMSLKATHNLLPLVFIGFAINLCTGTLFYIGDPMRYSVNIGFQIKMILVILSGLNALLFYWKINQPMMQKWDEFGDTSNLAKVIGILSLGLWFSVLICGRLIPYVGTG